MARTPITRGNIKSGAETKADTDRNGRRYNEDDIPTALTELYNNSDDENDSEVHKLPNCDTYWRRFGWFRSDFVRNSFTKNKFDVICKELHYINASVIDNLDKRQLSYQHQIWTINDDFMGQLIILLMKLLLMILLTI